MKGQEVSVIPGGDWRGDWRRPSQMQTGAEFAGPQRPTRGTVVRQTMFILQKTYSGLHGASRPLV